MTSTDGLVPITRGFLASYYDKYPFPPLSDDVASLSSQIRSLSNDLVSHFPPTDEEREMVEQAEKNPPHKIDENMWKNREMMEAIVFMLEKSHWPPSIQQQSGPEDAEVAALFSQLRDKFQETLNLLTSFQARNSDRVFNTVMTYLPQDFRGTIIRQQRDRSERNKQAEVDALINSGGSIRSKYALLWRQQMDRRRQLAQLGSATGVYKTLVKYLVGVPEVLLVFIKTINDDDGPMEEQRHRYGPPLYSLTTLVLFIHLYLSISLGRFESRKLNRDDLTALELAANIYTSEFERFITFMSEVFVNSPFFITAEEAGTLDGSKCDNFKEINIPAGKTYEASALRLGRYKELVPLTTKVSLTVDALNSYIAWDFSLIQTLNLDIGFSVECINESGEKTLILPYRRYESDQGNFCTCVAGNYKLIWDNSYSTFFKKALRFKVDCIPPVVEPVQLGSAEEKNED